MHSFLYLQTSTNVLAQRSINVIHVPRVSIRTVPTRVSVRWDTCYSLTNGRATITVSN